MSGCEVMNVEQAAEFLGFSAYTVRQKAARGEIPAKKVGREWRFRRSVLLEWLRGEDEMSDWLQQLSELESKATLGEWEATPNDSIKAWLEPPEMEPGYHAILNTVYGRDARLIAALRNSAKDLIERARRAEELERENARLRERERGQRKQLNHIEAYCEDYARDITTSHKMMRSICEVVGVEQGPDR